MKKRIFMITVLIILIILFATYLKNNNKSEFSFDATVIEKSAYGLLVESPSYEHFEIAFVKINNETTIVFDNNKKASLKDINIESKITITYDGIVQESYPAGIQATKIIVK